MVKKVLDGINRDEVTRLVMSLVDIPSPPGEEAAAGEFILKWLRGNGIPALRQEVEPGRVNAVGTLKGTGRGPSLMFNGHLDTSRPGTDEDYEALGEDESSFQPSAFVEDDVIYGLGSYNCKGPLATAMIALKALRESGIELSGDVMVGAVCGEIGVAPIGKYQGPHYHGHGFGARYLLANGVVPDLTLVVEPSSHQLVWALPGVLNLKVTAFGESAYVPFVNRAKWARENSNCVRNAVKMMTVIEDWAEAYEAKNTYDSPGGPVSAKVIIGAIEAGRPYKPNYSLASCSVYVDARVLPTRGLMEVKRELQDVLRDAGVDAEMQVYRAQKGYVGSHNEPLVAAIKESYREVFGEEPPAAKTEQASMWNDMNIFHELGVPAVKFGLRPVSTVSFSARRGAVGREGVRIDEYVKMTQIYALTAIKLCSGKGS